MILSFHPCFDADIQIILSDRPIDPDIRKSILEADAVILPQACTQNLYEICIASTAHIFPNYGARIQYPGKIGQGRLFRDLGLPHPKTLSWESVEQFKDAHADLKGMPHEIPFLIKEDRRHEAEGIFLVEDRKGLKQVLTHLALREGSGMNGFVIQEYVPCGGNVLRAVIIGKCILTYWKRPAYPAQKITTISRGALIDRDWQPELQEKVRASARKLIEKTGINLAAIDFVFPMADKDPEPLFLEINYYFGRRGLGGSESYYRLLYRAIQDWLAEIGSDPDSVKFV
jgi:ribosomal protein S6--L-glutamate ligase